MKHQLIVPKYFLQPFCFTFLALVHIDLARESPKRVCWVRQTSPKIG
jgi:hypothetical protein